MTEAERKRELDDNRVQDHLERGVYDAMAILDGLFPSKRSEMMAVGNARYEVVCGVNQLQRARRALRELTGATP
jgi:hypothetical protein